MNGLKFSYIKNKVILTAVFIFFLSFLNFQFNLFNVVSEFRFNYFQVESEQFVLDGFLNHSINDEPLQLGQFSRPSIDMFNDGEKYKGLIVCANKDSYTLITNAPIKGKDAITINESLPDVSLSKKYKDKSVYGVISSGEEDNGKGTRKYERSANISNKSNAQIFVCLRTLKFEVW